MLTLRNRFTSRLVERPQTRNKLTLLAKLERMNDEEWLATALNTTRSVSQQKKDIREHLDRIGFEAIAWGRCLRNSKVVHATVRSKSA